ncbi:hypothetical protein FGG08_003925 [Glutinoglossum americanum]|uniref:Zn(2)-C6 fungal-type domain-containing protein n=1 Tax=Glutinoglossum americanum TaxID=1670608 RepID=A0A9P8ICB1_9PEZI|nr:hypothetical protein FGG08_003925 [Glutinoglossum americanum]
MLRSIGEKTLTCQPSLLMLSHLAPHTSVVPGAERITPSYLNDLVGDYDQLDQVSPSYAGPGLEVVSHDYSISPGTGAFVDFEESRSVYEPGGVLNFLTWASTPSVEYATPAWLMGDSNPTLFAPNYNRSALDSAASLPHTRHASESFYYTPECSSEGLFDTMLSNNSGATEVFEVFDLPGQRGIGVGIPEDSFYLGQDQGPRLRGYQARVSHEDSGTGQSFRLTKQNEIVMPRAPPYDGGASHEVEASSSQYTGAPSSCGATDETTSRPRKYLSPGRDATAKSSARHCGLQQHQGASIRAAPPGHAVLDLGINPSPLVLGARPKKRRKREIPAKGGPEQPSGRRRRAGTTCIRCKLMHEKCSGTFPCSRCSGMEIRAWSQICTKAKFGDRACFSRGLYSDRASKMNDNVNWCPGGGRSLANVEVSVSLGLLTSIPLNLSKCEVKDSTLLEHIIWRVEGEPIVRIPTEAVSLCQRVPREQLDAVIDEVIPYALQQLVGSPTDGIRNRVFHAAYKRSKSERDLFLTNALRIWAAQTTFFKNHWRIVAGAETINARYYMPLDAALVPRMLALQLEQVIESYMKVLERDFLHDLERMLFDRDLPWASAYLAAFVYLSILEGDTWDLEAWKAKGGMQEVPESQRKFWPLATELATLIDRNHHQASVMVCHAKAALGRGQPLFSMNGAGELIPAVGAQDCEACELAAELAEEFKNLEKYVPIEPFLSSRQKASYSVQDRQSLTYMFTSKLLVTDQ